MRPTRAALWPPVAAAVLYGLAGQTGAGWLVLGATLSLALPVSALVLRPRLAGLTVSAEPLHTRLGESAQDRWVVRNAGRASSPVLSLIDSASGLDAVVAIVPALPRGGRLLIELDRTPSRRGFVAQRSFELTSTAPWGLLRSRRSVVVDVAVAVGPRVAQAPFGAREGAGAGGIPSALAGPGTEVLGLRPWRVGDGGAAISARATARHGRPVVLERERERGSRLVVVCTGPGGGPEWEAAIERSCSTVERALREGRVPVLLAAGLPFPGRCDLRAVLAWHAALDGCSPLDGPTASAVRRTAGSTGTVAVFGPASALLSGLTVVSL